MINIVIADGHTLFREAVMQLLKCESPSYNIVGVDRIGDVGHDFYPDLLIVSADVEDIEQISNLPLKGKIGIFLLADSKSNLEVSAGTVPSFVISKNVSGRIFVKNILEIVDGKNQNFFGLEIPSIEKSHAKTTTDFKLTSREKEVLSYLAKGLSNKEISKILSIQVVTTKLHVRGICKKMSVNNRTQAAILAQKMNWNLI